MESAEIYKNNQFFKKNINSLQESYIRLNFVEIYEFHCFGLVCVSGPAAAGRSAAGAHLPKPQCPAGCGCGCGCGAAVGASAPFLKRCVCVCVCFCHCHINHTTTTGTSAGSSTAPRCQPPCATPAAPVIAKRRWQVWMNVTIPEQRSHVFRPVVAGLWRHPVPSTLLGCGQGQHPASGIPKGNLMHFHWDARAATTQYVVASGSSFSTNFPRLGNIVCIHLDPLHLTHRCRWEVLDHGLEVGVRRQIVTQSEDLCE